MPEVSVYVDSTPVYTINQAQLVTTITEGLPLTGQTVKLSKRRYSTGQWKDTLILCEVQVLGRLHRVYFSASSRVVAVVVVVVVVIIIVAIM